MLFFSKEKGFLKSMGMSAILINCPEAFEQNFFKALEPLILNFDGHPLMLKYFRVLG